MAKRRVAPPRLTTPQWWQLVCDLASLRAWAYEVHPDDHVLLEKIDKALAQLRVLQLVRRAHGLVLEGYDHDPNDDLAK